MYDYDTVTEALADLKKRGYLINFNLAFDKLMCVDTGRCLNPTEFEITETYRFEGNTNPADEDVVYAVESKDGSMKGMLTAAYGVYADSVDTHMLKKLSFRN